MKIENLIGKCLLCGKEYQEYDTSPVRTAVEARHCGCSSTSLGIKGIEERFGDSYSLFPTVYPIPREEASGGLPDDEARKKIVIPPAPDRLPAIDALAFRWPAAQEPAEAQDRLPLPYVEQPDETGGLRCGNATLHDMDQVATLFGITHGSLTVCDMSTYQWSNTLKDPRSWAVIRNALRAGIKALGVWTAGNAGLSIAKIAYVVNRRLKPEDRIQVYCYSASLAEEVRAVIQGFRADVSEMPTPVQAAIYTPWMAFENLNAQLPRGGKIDPATYWDVSDGWDGVGLYMYRLLGRQLCAHLDPKPDYIVAPVGTGDLFFGLHLGRMDCLEKGLLEPSQCQLVAAIPEGESILTNYEFYRLHPHGADFRESASSEWPVAPKLTTVYTPLLFVMYRAFCHAKRVLVSRKEQWHAAKVLLGNPEPWLATEPSALVAFGALRQLATLHETEGRPRTQQIMERGTEMNVLVVSTGLGIMGQSEAEYMRYNLKDATAL